VTIKAGIYVRVSSEEQAREGKTSLQYQENVCRKYADDRGYDVAGVYSDPGVSGAAPPGYDRGQRRGLQQLLDDAKKGKVDVLIAFAVDRLSRDQNLVGMIAFQVIGAAAQLEFATEEFENSPIGTFMRQVKAYAAEEERAKIRKRARQGRQGRASQGLSNASTPPYGYKRERGGKMAIDRREAAVVRRVFRDYTQEGISLRQISISLTRDRVPLKRGGDPKWGPEGVRRMLTRDAYTGLDWQNKKRAIAPGRYVPNPREEWIPMKYPKIIDRATFDAARARLDSNRSWRRRAREDRALFILQGLLRCAECGFSMLCTRGGSSPNRVRAYTCHGQSRHALDCRKPAWIRAESIEAPVWERIVEACRNPELWVASSEEYQAAELALGGDPDSQAAELRERIADEERTIAKLQAVIRLSPDAPRAAARLVKDIEQIEETVDALRFQLEEVEGKVSDRAAQALARAQAEEYARTIGPKLDAATAADKAEIIRALVQSVKVDKKGTISINAWLPHLEESRNGDTSSTLKLAKLSGVRP
jgi:site-specific DNA recombinase